ncbi:hypothetical protein ABGB12_14955 [Actinocorallia sp. B10E7]|uniref:hypothetical protein n=1 Tax=Actinocorallia sp. B10E7 TaxID=3153558 RepID=UPI00325D95A8
MSSDEPLESMIKACVDHEVLDVALPPGFAERVTGRAREKRRPRRLQWPIGLAVLATAATLVSVEASLQLQPADDHVTAPAGPATPAAGPRALDGRVTVTSLPLGATISGQAETDPRGDRFIWRTDYRWSHGGGFAAISVFSGNVTIDGIAAEYRIAQDPAERVRVPVSRGEAMVWTHDRHHVILQPEPGLVVYVVTSGLSRERAVRIAEGVRVG